jgi:hypothetical protein
VVVDAGLTVTAVPLAAEIEELPPVMTPAPPEKMPVRLELVPAVMVAGLAVKLVMEGAGPVVVLTEPPQAATHRHTAETVARVASRSKNFIFMPPKIHSRSLANGTSLPDD